MEWWKPSSSSREAMKDWYSADSEKEMDDMPGDGGVCGENAIEEMDEAEKDRLGMEFMKSGSGAT